MPIILNKTINNNSILMLWHIVEDLHYFENNCQLFEDSSNKYSNFKSERRKKEFLAGRLLLQSIGLGDQNIIYDAQGAPKIINSDYSYISISHNKNYAAIILGKQKVGIDIESESDKLHKIMHKFLSDEEFEKYNSASTSCLNLLWSCKEALFKYAHFSAIDFKKQLVIKDLSWENKTANCVIIDKSGTNFYVKANFITFENNILVYIAND